MLIIRPQRRKLLTQRMHGAIDFIIKIHSYYTVELIVHVNFLVEEHIKAMRNIIHYPLYNNYNNVYGCSVLACL